MSLAKKKTPIHIHVWTPDTNLFVFCFFSLAPSDFDSESLQADGIHRKTSAAMVPETKEPGPAQLAQEVPGSQVNTDRGAPLLKVCVGRNSCPSLAFLQRYGLTSLRAQSSSSLFLTRTRCNAPFAAAVPAAPLPCAHSNLPDTLINTHMATEPPGSVNTALLPRSSSTNSTSKR